MRNLADLRAPVVSVESRKPDIHDHQMGLDPGEFRQDFPVIFHTINLQFPFLPPFLHCLQYTGIIFYHINTIHSHPSI